MADGGVRIEITKGYDEINYCSDLRITTTQEAEAALANFDETYQQYQNIADGNGMEEAQYHQLAKSTVEKFRSGEFPLKQGESNNANGNTKGIITGQASASSKGADESNPEVTAETPEEAEEGDSWLDGLQLGLDVAGMAPAVGAFADIANAGISLLRGDYGGAAFAMFAAIPVVGDAAAAAKLANKGIVALEKKAAKKAAKKVEEEAAAKTAKAGAGNSGGKVKGKGKKKKGPCDHLKKGNGKGDYRGGAHSETSKPMGDGLDSHHLPANDVSPLNRSAGPAIQMEVPDHKVTSSNGVSHNATKYRKDIGKLLSEGKWRKALAKEIWDIKNIKGTKYNEAIKEMLLYFKCLEKNNLLS